MLASLWFLEIARKQWHTRWGHSQAVASTLNITALQKELAGAFMQRAKNEFFFKKKKKKKKNPVLHSQSHVHKHSPGLEAVSAITGIPASALFPPRALQNLKASQEHV